MVRNALLPASDLKYVHLSYAGRLSITGKVLSGNEVGSHFQELSFDCKKKNNNKFHSWKKVVAYESVTLIKYFYLFILIFFAVGNQAV